MTTPAQAMELDLLETLGWEIDVTLPFEYLDAFLLQGKLGKLAPEDMCRIRRHAEVFIQMCYTGERACAPPPPTDVHIHMHTCIHAYVHTHADTRMRAQSCACSLSVLHAPYSPCAYTLPV